MDPSILSSEDTQCFTDNNNQVHIKNCASLQRMLHALQYYSVLKLDEKSSVNTNEVFINFCETAYPHLITDYQHIITTHDPHLEVINDQLRESGQYKNCNLSECALFRRHNNDTVRETVIALTFDDGPHPEFTPMVLELLQKFDAKATFFLIGKNVEKYPDLVKDIVNKGHIIGNHSYKHSNNYGFLSTNSLISDLNKNKQLIYDTVGLKMKFFRPPFGVTNPKITKAILSLKLKTFGWSIRTYDTTAKKTEVIVSRVKAKLKKGEVILMHDTSKKSVEALDKVLNYMNEKNLKSITLTQLFSYEAYEK